MLKITGYADRVSVAPGGTIRFMVSCDDLPEYRAELRRIVCGDENPDGPGYRDEHIPCAAEGTYPGRRQEIHAGSYGIVPANRALAALETFTIAMMAWPTTPARSVQGLLSIRCAATGTRLALQLDGDDGLVLDLRTNDTAFRTCTGTALQRRQWTLVGVALDRAAGTVRLVQKPLHAGAGVEAIEVGESLPIGDGPMFDEGTVLFGAVHAASGLPERHYNGKIDSPRIVTGTLNAAEMRVAIESPAALGSRVAAAWDFALGIDSDHIRDRSPNRLDGHLVNLPARAVTGYRWTGEAHDWRHRPDHYGAVHFHDDDLYDAGWETDFALTVPDALPSGVYAMRCHAGEHEAFITFCVRPPRGRTTARAAFLMPTASYMAYGNNRLALDCSATEIGMGRLIELTDMHLFLQEHPEYGLSLYETHGDGSGVMYSSRLRPLVDFAPKVRNVLGGTGSGLWQFNADTHILAWLEHVDEPFDVITDEDLHAEGLALIRDYGVIVTGTHPEYYSTAMLDALQAYTDRGGRLMYLGGNGFYWRIAWHADRPGAIELRRAEDGIRPWACEPGEYHHAFTGELGGLWRRQERSPNRLVGVGMTSQGFDISSPFHRTRASHDPRAAFIFEGVDDEIVGDFGLSGGAAAGLEIDRADVELGTPPHALVLASSRCHTDVYLQTPEDMLDPTPDMSGTQSELIRADMVFFETANGGGVFSTSSIAWAGSLSHAGYDNNVARISTNVLRRFVDPAPLRARGQQAPSGG